MEMFEPDALSEEMEVESQKMRMAGKTRNRLRLMYLCNEATIQLVSQWEITKNDRHIVNLKEIFK